MQFFKRQHAFLLAYITYFYSELFYYILSLWVALYRIPIARSNYKDLRFYRSWAHFLARRIDDIWSNERWSRSCWLRPAEGVFLERAEESHCKDLRLIFRGPVIYLAGIYRRPYDIRWVKAPADLQLIGFFNDYCIYKILLTNYFFIIKNPCYQDLSDQKEIASGLSLGMLHSREEAWLYMFEAFSKPQ